MARPNVSDIRAENGNVESEYDDAGRLTKVTDLDGFSTTMKYSLTDQIIEQTDPLGHTVISEYDRRDRLIRKVDPRGNETRFAYDDNGNLTSMTDALGRVTLHGYDGEDRIIRTVDSQGAVSTVTYDAAGRVIRETDPLGNSVTHVYDAVGNEITTYDARGIKLRQVDYDERSFPVTTRDAIGHSTSVEYDAVGRLTQAQDPLKRTTQYEYDALDRPFQTRDPLNRVSTKEYWPDDFVRHLVNPLDASTEFRYDQARRLDRVTTAAGRRTFLEYNKRDLLTEVSKPSGITFNYSYDEIGRLTRFSSSGPNLIVPEIHYDYDENGNLVTVSTRSFSDISPVPRLRRTYDALDRMISFTDGEGNRLDYEYDEAGNLSSLVYPDGRQVNYSYDAANRLTTISDWAGRITRYTYNANSQVTRVAFPNGTNRRMGYDPNGRVILRKDFDSNDDLIVGYSYSYDSAGQVSAETLEHPPPPHDTPGIDMTYDSDNRLLTFNGQSVSSDADGNLTRGPLGPAFSFEDFGYDHRNNLISAGDVNYFYDQEDRLVGFTNSEGTTRLAVSPSGDLSQVVEKTAPNGTDTQYVYGIGLAYEVTGSEIKVYHYDHRGSTTALTGGNGTIVGTVAYGPFGELVQRTGETDSLFLFSGLFGVITDPTNELYHMRFRWFSPQIKRFVTADAHYGDIALPHTLNRYAYTGNNPINRIDPGGEFFNLIGAAIGAVVGGLVSVVIKVASDAISGKKVDFNSGDYWAEIGGAFVSGAVTSACIGSGAGIAAASACGAAGSSLGYLTTQGLKGEPVNAEQLAFEALVGGISGAVAGGAAKAARFGRAAGPKPAVGNRFGQFRQGFRADSPTSFKLGLLARDQAIQGSDEYLVSVILPKAGVRKLIGTTVGKEVAKAVARRTLVVGSLALTSLGLKVAGRVAGNFLFNSQAGGAAGSGNDNTDIEDGGRQAVSGGVKGVYGEYVHWQLYINALTLAGRPIPNNPNNVLATF